MAFILLMKKEKKRKENHSPLGDKYLNKLFENFHGSEVGFCKDSVR